MPSLADLISDYKSRFELNEYEIWRLIAQGFHSFWQYKKPGMATEDVTALKRAAAKEQGWFLNGNYLPMSEWLRRYAQWQPS